MKKFLCAALAAAVLLCLGATVFSAPGDQEDPVVSFSYLDSVLKPQLRQELDALNQKEEAKTYRDSFCALTESVAAYNLDTLRTGETDTMVHGTLMLKKGDVLTLLPGAQISLRSGAVKTNTGALVNVTAGQPVPDGAALEKGAVYMKGDQVAGGVTVSSDTAEFYFDGVCRLSSAAGVDYGSMAQALKTMGLFRGTGVGFDLESSATRIQGLIMFLRILGEEDAALAYTGSHPFTDIPSYHWAYRYVAYAYSKGYTTGTSAALFTPDAKMTAQQYLTFVLRALSYREGADFTYQSVLEDAVSVGLFSSSEIAAVGSGEFRRSRMVYLSYYSLYGIDQASQTMLLGKLIDAGALNETKVWEGICQVNGQRIQ